MLPFLKKAADALAGAVKHRVTMAGIIVDALRASGDQSQAKIDALKDLLERYEEKPNQRAADAIAKAICRLIKRGVLAQRGSPADEYLSYVQIRMEREMDPLGAFEALALRKERAR